MVKIYGNYMKAIFDFNHISKVDTERLRTRYCYYHKLYTCYKWKYKRLKRIRLSLNMTGISLVVIRSVVGGVTTNLVVIGSISGSDVLIQTYLTKCDIRQKIERCRFAYTLYKKILS